MSTRFKTLRLIGKRHRFEWVNGLQDENGDDVYGMFHWKRKLIQICEGQTHDDERETVLHEILHALEAQMNAEIPEAKLRQLAVGLYASLKDNPRLVGYLLEEEADDEGTVRSRAGSCGASDCDGGCDHGAVVRSP